MGTASLLPCLVAMLAALWMVQAGRAKHMLVARASKRRCPSCDRLVRAGEPCACSASRRRRSKAL